MDIKSIGSLLAVLGIMAVGLDFVGMVPSILAWVYNWGENIAWAIKIGFIVVGGILYFVGMNNVEEENAEEAK